MSQHWEQGSLLGLGVFKGQSLCLTPNDVYYIHKRFSKLYKNKICKETREKDDKQKQRLDQIEKEGKTFAPEINQKSSLIAQKLK
mmetsp:Transcript_29741/g.28914  ORF Transcript_29741/g.28914 Transcript_29741/m.28914 type:complete len:85 (+) Transcript_29741:1144-1398(+)